MSRALKLVGLRNCRAIGVVTLASIAGPAYAQWTVINLHPAGAAASWAYGVGGNQQVGSAIFNGVARASLWTGSAAAWVDLHPAGATASGATGVDAGQQTGWMLTNGLVQACLWTGTAGSLVELHPPGLPTGYQSRAEGVHAGQQVGSAGYAGYWTGSPASWVDLSPTELGVSEAFGTDGIQQVGYIRIGGAYGNSASLWSGTAASRINLQPAGSIDSIAWGVHGGRQVGWAYVGGRYQASIWSGSASSWVSLHPVGAHSSVAYAVYDGWQAGTASLSLNGPGRASLWRGTAASWEDLSLALTGLWDSSVASDVWTDGATLYVVGYGRNLTTGRDEALLWTRPLCYPNCDASTAPSILNVQDFTCFLQRYAAADPYANCDNSSLPPVLNVQDFTCFLQRYAAGCP